MRNPFKKKKKFKPINPPEISSALQAFDWPKATQLDLVFPTFDTPPEILELTKTDGLDLSKGRAKFNELFYSGGKAEYRPGLKNTDHLKSMSNWVWCFMGSFAPKHEHKEAVCALIFQEILIL